MKKGKIPWLLIVPALLVTLTVRIWYVNRGKEYPEVITYQMGEEVALRDTIFYDSYENREDYTITVNSAEILSYDEFLAKYEYIENPDEPLYLEGDMTFPEMVYDIELTVRNTNTEESEAGVDFFPFTLYAKDYYMQNSGPLFAISNPTLQDGSMSFRLRPGTQMDFHLPFGFAPSAKILPIQVEEAREDEIYLVVSYYPKQLQIQIREK